MPFAPDSWADQLIFPPWIEDGDGCLFNQAFQLCKFPGARLANRDDAAPVPFHHAEPDSAGGAQEHA